MVVKLEIEWKIYVRRYILGTSYILFVIRMGQVDKKILASGLKQIIKKKKDFTTKFMSIFTAFSITCIIRGTVFELLYYYNNKTQKLWH